MHRARSGGSALSAYAANRHSRMQTGAHTHTHTQRQSVRVSINLTDFIMPFFTKCFYRTHEVDEIGR